MSPRKRRSISLVSMFPRIAFTALIVTALVSAAFAGWRWYSHASLQREAELTAQETAIPRADSPEAFAAAFRELLPGLIAECGVPALERRDYLSREGQEPRSIRIKVPPDLSLIQLHIAIEALVDTLGGECVSAEMSADGAVLTLSAGFAGETMELITLRKTPGLERTFGSLAILIEQPYLDDPDILGLLCRSGIPLTLAIAPGTPSVNEITTVAHDSATPLLIIIPFAAVPDTSSGMAIASKDQTSTIESKLERYFREVKGAAGACITTTEGAASDSRVIEDMAVWLAKRGLVCVVAIPSGNSPAWSIMQKCWVKGIVLSQRLTGTSDSTSKLFEELVAGVRQAGFVSISLPGDKDNLAFLAHYLPMIRSRDDLRFAPLDAVIR